MRLRDFWRDLPKWAKVSFWTSIALGLICFAAGLYGDALSFWGSRSYGVNMFTSLTGALFGVPFAGILVTWFTTSLESRASLAAAKTSARALTAFTWIEFKELAENHLRAIEPAALRESGPEVTAAMDRIKEIVKPVLNDNFLALAKPDESEFKWAKDSDAGRVRDDMLAVATVVQEASAHFNALLMNSDRIAALNQEWAALRSKWAFLSTTVRAQRLGAGLGWGMPESADSTFAYRFAADTSPLNGLVVPLHNKVIHTGLAIALALQDEPASPFKVAERLSDASLNYFDPKTLQTAATRAADAFEHLRAALQEVEAAGWPDGPAPR